MKLYGSLTSPYVRKLRVLIIERGLPCEFVVAGANDPGSPVPALNPLGKVPVLALDDGDALFDSPVILEYLDTVQPPAWLAPAGAVRWETLRWEALADGIIDAVVARTMEARRPAEQQSAETMRHQEGKIERALAYVEQRLPKTAWVMGAQFGIADLCIGTALEYVDFRWPHDWRSRHPRLAAWLANVSARPAFVETRPPKA
jgi:glutathione S-transferase